MNIAFQLHNESKKILCIYLEPWGGDYHLNPGDTYTIKHKNIGCRFITTCVHDECICLWVEGDLEYPDLIEINGIAVE